MNQPSSSHPYSSPPRAPDPRQGPPKASEIPITTALVVVNIIVFVLEEQWGGSEAIATLVRMGAIYPPDTGLVRWASLISYGYLHIGPLHIGMNMFALWSIGRLLEPLFGGSRFFVLYTLSMLGGGVAIMFAPNPHVTAGASGALFGLLGAICALLWRRYRAAIFDDERSAIRSSIGRLLLPNLLISLLPGVSLMGHAGGLLIGGAFASYSLQGKPLRPGRALAPSRALDVAAALLVLLTLLSVAFVWWALQPWAVSVGSK